MSLPRAQWSTTGQGHASLTLSGSWNADHASALETIIASALAARPPLATTERIVLDGARIVGLDTIGAHLLERIRAKLAMPEPASSAQPRPGEAKFEIPIEGLAPDQLALLAEVAAPRERLAPPPPPIGGAYHLLSDIGAGVVQGGRDLSGGVAFLGAVVVAFGRLLAGTARIRLPSIVTQLERVGLRGVPIIALISFLVGAIIAQQSIFQLRTFGTVHFVADLLGILVLRELGVLLTSIMIAGRSGSSFTAELGSMKMREEIDALETMGLDPLEVLVLPRLLALMIGLPLLTFVSSMAGIGGGAMVAYLYGGVSFDVFFSRLQGAIGFNTFMVGMIKAPFMAIVIGIIACIEGFAVRGSAESLGAHTTASVVKSIFIVIVVDGLFAMFFAAIDY